MCLVVMYGVKKDVNVSLMEKMLYMNYDVKPLLNEFTLIGENLSDYNFYSVGVCNCGSYMCELSNTEFDNFKDYYLHQQSVYKKRKLDVENLRNNPKYAKLSAKFKKEYEKQRKNMQKYSVNDTKKMAEYQKFLSKNSVFVDDMLGGLVNDANVTKYSGNIDDIINTSVLDMYSKDTSIIDGALTIADDILIIPIWTDGSLQYNVTYTDIEYKDLNENLLGKLKCNTGYKIY